MSGGKVKSSPIVAGLQQISVESYCAEDEERAFNRRAQTNLQDVQTCKPSIPQNRSNTTIYRNKLCGTLQHTAAKSMQFKWEQHNIEGTRVETSDLLNDTLD